MCMLKLKREEQADDAVHRFSSRLVCNILCASGSTPEVNSFWPEYGLAEKYGSKSSAHNLKTFGVSRNEKTNIREKTKK